MSNITLWWLAALGLAALEMFTGTFYLLMLALGLASGAVAAMLGLALPAQFTLAALAGALAVAALYLLRRRRPGDPSARASRSVNLDVGGLVHIEHWQPDGTTTIRYRGAPWTAIHRSPNAPAPGPHRIVELEGSRLVVEPTHSS